MATLTANPHSALPPSWDETIVPSLRKRLESESRILTKRLSTISTTDESSPLNTPTDVQRTASPPQSHVGDYTDPSAAYLQRPSAIPRPSYSRVGERAGASPSPPPQPMEPVGKHVSKRQRTQSTPYPFNHPIPSGSALPNGHSTNGMPTSSSSASTSSRVQSPPLGGRATPSRIPTVSSRVRSGSLTSQGLGPLNGAKSSLPPSHKFLPLETQPMAPDPVEMFTPDASPPMNASTTSLARQRIVDERPPFTNEPSPTVLESEFTDRPSIEEERTFQHWYRGDVSRNGGVGEYRVGKRMEMLDIANYGHALRASAGRTRAFEEPTPRSEGTGLSSRKRAESVSSRERASIYIDPQDETATGRVLDETPLTDIEAEETDYERDYYSQTEFGIQHPYHQIPPPNDNRPLAVLSPTLPSRPGWSSNKSQSRIPQTTARPNTLKESTSIAPAATTELSVPIKGNQRDRGRTQATQAPANARSKPATKVNGQKRSKSAVDVVRSPPERRESSDYTGLADAVPESCSPAPRNGNWDEVILPTVARRMGIEYEKETPEAAAKRKARESRVAPAPGTFGYDHTKYKPPRSDEDIRMDEFGTRQSGFAPEQPVDELYAPRSPSEESTHDPAPNALRSRRETMPPFSHYAHPPQDQSPMPGPDSERAGRVRRKERQDVPQILVRPPTGDAANGDMMYVEDGQSAGCCKCVIM